MDYSSLYILVAAAGIGQLLLVLGSLSIPYLLQWRADTARLRPLTRQVFWTYAAYIWVANCCFGLLSSLAPHWLLDQSPLAGVVTGFMTAYWGARLAVQFLYFDRDDAPAGAVFRLAEAALVSLFVFLTAVYSTAVAFNLGGIGR